MSFAGKKMLVGYLPAGFPTAEDSVRALITLAEAGCDAIEVGLPYTDPVVDGPDVQTANAIALRGGAGTDYLFRVVERVATATEVPVLVMTYWNPVEQHGVERFAARLAQAGGAGCVLPDLPVHHSAAWRAAADRHGLASVFVAAPSSQDARLREIAAAGSGFVYAASAMGVTGMRAEVGGAELVRRLRAVTRLPVFVGLGVSDGEQAAQVARFADGVIVGSALVRRLLDAPDVDTGIAGLAALCAELADGVRSASV